MTSNLPAWGVIVAEQQIVLANEYATGRGMLGIICVLALLAITDSLFNSY